MFSGSRTRIWFFSFLLALALTGALMGYVGTRWGPALGDDSFDYIGAAQSLAHGMGLHLPAPNGAMRPLGHFPPFFSIVLALPELVGLNALTAARVLNLVLFAGTIAITGLAIHAVTHSMGFSVLGAALSVLSVVMLEIHTAAMSEALYLFLALIGLILLADFH